MADAPLTDEELAVIERWSDFIVDELGPQPWRQGRKVGRTLYRQQGAEPSDNDRLIGVMDSEEDAEFIVFARNHVPFLIADLRASRAEVERLRAELDEAQLRSIEARNPGIDMAEVRRIRRAPLGSL